MTKTIWTCEFKLNKGTSEAEFLAASKALGKEYISKQKGYISWQQLKGDNTWIDVLTWKTLEDAKAFESSGNNGGGGELADKYFSFVDLMSCKTGYYSVEQEH